MVGAVVWVGVTGELPVEDGGMEPEVLAGGEMVVMVLPPDEPPEPEEAPELPPPPVWRVVKVRSEEVTVFPEASVEVTL